jgi:tetratricopeptide (TPR) repeat protein
MKKSLTVIICAFVLLAGFTGQAHALTLDEFRGKAGEFFKKEISAETMLQIANAALAGEAKNDNEYGAYVYAIRGNVYWSQNNMEKALADAQKSVELNPKTQAGYVVLGEVLRDTGKHEEGARAIERAAANVENAEQKKRLLLFADNMRQSGRAISPAVLWKAFDDNEVAAEDAYKNKNVALRGKINSITTGITGNPEINFAVDQIGINTVVCEFDKEARPQIATLKKGQQVLLAGTCRGMTMGSVFLSKCRIVE